MKFTKVKNLRLGVSPLVEKSTGFLYIDPPKDSKCVEYNLQRHIDAQITAAQRLYHAFLVAEKKGKNAEETQISAEERVFAGMLDKYILAKLKNNTLLSCDEMSKELCSQTERRCRNLDKLNCREIVNKYLRRTLYLRASDGAVFFVQLMAGQVSWEGLKPEERKQVDHFLEELNQDYQFARIRKQVGSSLEHQNMLIQPNDELVFLPAKITQSSQSSMKEKEGFTKFLTDYACLEPDDRRDLRLRLRRLIDLYFYGENSVLPGEQNEWEDHAKHRQETGWFSEAVQRIVSSVAPDAKRSAIFKAIKEIKQAMRDENIHRYRRSLTFAQANKELFFDDIDISKFWIHHIENAVERIYSKYRSVEEFRFSVGYLSEKVWKDLINYLCIKYIAIGKAVYHFASDTGIGDLNANVCMGKISDDKVKGLTSFDYEQIKAEEMLQRSLAVYVSFAANHLSNATMMSERGKNREDFLTLGKEEIRKYAKPGILRNVCQFWGGVSNWNDFSFDQYLSGPDKELDFLFDLKEIVYALRNESIHFNTLNKNEGDWNKELVVAMFEHDCKTCSSSLKRKIYSNNLPMFYSEKDLLAILNVLYEKQTDRAAQIPSYNRIIVRKNFSAFIRDDLQWKPNFKGYESADALAKYESGIYYLLKEVYYNLFLQGRGMKGDYNVLSSFLSWCKNPQNGKENILAFQSFQKRVQELSSSGKLSFSEICQCIMTEYNLYNNGNRKVRSSYAKGEVPDSYDHYRMLLYKGIREVFAAYVKEEFGMLASPSIREMPKEAEFLADYQSPAYDMLSAQLAKNIDLQKWYVLGRLLNPRQVNQLYGALSHYVQYSSDIRRRGEETRHTVKQGLSVKMCRRYERILQVCIQLNGSTTNVLTDYFDDEDDYAKYISRFLRYEGIIPGTSLPVQLKEFSNQYIDDTDNDLKEQGIFYDERNPIINRNILLAKLFGTEKALAQIFEENKVTEEDIRLFHDQRKKIENYRSTNKCKTEDEQREVKRYQEIKNHVEFYDLREYGEILGELQSQLMDWCYLRERDLMYFQLGFHYLCLKKQENTPDQYKTIRYGNRKIEGAILYQIIAMYTNGLPVYYDNAGVNQSNPFSSVGSKLTDFRKYTKGALQDTDLKQKEDTFLYIAGLELFENIKEHENIINLRNYIDHFHYYAWQDRSMLSLYSEVFDRFFTYDMKYQKNVVNMLYNILMQHFVKANFSFGTDVKTVGEKASAENKPCAALSLTEGKGLCSEIMTYCLDDKANSKLTLNAKSDEFLQNLAKLLCYPDKPGDVVKKYRESNKMPIGRKSMDYGNKRVDKSTAKKVRDDNRLQNTPFANLLKDFKV